MNRVLGCLLVLCMLGIGGCAANRFSAYRRLVGFQLAGEFPMSGRYDKAVADSRSGTVFVLDKAAQEIHIFRRGQQINSIGGLGFERSNFQRLTDIGVDSDGGLLALDSAQKLLRKFSPEGLVTGELEFTTLRQPELFCIGGDGNLFLYDAASSEIVCFSQLDGAELYRFGRFELQLPVTLDCNRDYLYAYSEATHSSSVFYLLGQFKETLPGQVIFDAFNNPVRAADVVPVHSSRLPKLLSVNGDTLVVQYPDQIQLHKILYGRGDGAAQ